MNKSDTVRLVILLGEKNMENLMNKIMVSSVVLSALNINVIHCIFLQYNTFNDGVITCRNLFSENMNVYNCLFKSLNNPVPMTQTTLCITCFAKQSKIINNFFAYCSSAGPFFVNYGTGVINESAFSDCSTSNIYNYGSGVRQHHAINYTGTIAMNKYGDFAIKLTYSNFENCKFNQLVTILSNMSYINIIKNNINSLNAKLLQNSNIILSKIENFNFLLPPINVYTDNESYTVLNYSQMLTPIPMTLNYYAKFLFFTKKIEISGIVKQEINLPGFFDTIKVQECSFIGITSFAEIIHIRSLKLSSLTLQHCTFNGCYSDAEIISLDSYSGEFDEANAYITSNCISYCIGESMIYVKLDKNTKLMHEKDSICFATHFMTSEAVKPLHYVNSQELPTKSSGLNVSHGFANKFATMEAKHHQISFSKFNNLSSMCIAALDSARVLSCNFISIYYSDHAFSNLPNYTIEKCVFANCSIPVTPELIGCKIYSESDMKFAKYVDLNGSLDQFCFPVQKHRLAVGYIILIISSAFVVILLVALIVVCHYRRDDMKMKRRIGLSTSILNDFG